MSEFGSGWEDAPPSTNWREYGLTEIARMFDGGDDAVTSRHERAWMRMQTLCAHHGEQLRRAAEQLARRWPPEQSPASRIFISRVTQLADAMDEMATAAVRNAVGVRFITDAVARARAEVAELHRARELDASDLAPQIAEFHRREFDDRARQVMATADSAIVDGYGYLTPPRPPIIRQAPISPDQTTGSPGAGAHVGSARPASSDFTTTPITPIRSPDPSFPPGHGTDIDSPPILDGGLTPPDSLPVPGAGGPVAIGLLGPATRDAVVGSEVIGLTPGAGAASARGSVLSTPSSGTARPGAAPLVAGGGLGHAGARGQTGALPPGGMLGGRSPNPAGTASAAGAARRRRSDPDDPWQVRQGVPGVLEPDPEPTHHDPGPGVLGLDR